MRGNLGQTGLRRRRRRADPMREYDRLPPELRDWLANAALPWRPGSVRDAFRRALARTGDPERAIGELSRTEARLLERDRAHLWGKGSPQSDRGPDG